MNTQIELYSKLQDPLAAIDRMGNFFAKSGMFGCDKAEQGQVLAMVCLAENKSPIEIMRTFHIMDGKLSKKAMAAFAEYRKLGGKCKWLKTGDDGKEAEGEFTFEGQTIKVKYSIDEAKRQGLVRPKGNWEKTPSNMLRARVITNAIGMLAPEVFAGDTSDGEESAPVAEAAPLLGKKEKMAKVESVETVQPTPEPVTSQPATDQKPVDTVIEAKVEIVTEPAKAGLAADKLEALEKAIGADNAVAALEWLKAKGWIKNVLDEISLERADRIISKPAEFISHIKGAK